MADKKITNAEIPNVEKIGVYAIHNKTKDKYYIGSSINIYTRMKQQKSMINSRGLNYKFLDDVFEIGFKDVYEFLVLKTFEDNTITETELRKWEEFFIEKYNSRNNGYNTAVPWTTGKYGKKLLVCERGEAWESVSCRIPKGTKERIKKNGFTVNGIINKLLIEELDRLENK